MDLILMKKKLLNYIQNLLDNAMNWKENLMKSSAHGSLTRDLDVISYILKLRLLSSILILDNTLQRDSKNLEDGNRKSSRQQEKLKLMRLFFKS